MNPVRMEYEKALFIADYCNHYLDASGRPYIPVGKIIAAANIWEEENSPPPNSCALSCIMTEHEHQQQKEQNNG